MLGAYSMVMTIDQDTFMAVHIYSRSKMPQYREKPFSYFPITGFKATVCASPGDNRHNCAPIPDAIPDGGEMVRSLTMCYLKRLVSNEFASNKFSVRRPPFVFISKGLLQI